MLNIDDKYCRWKYIVNRGKLHVISENEKTVLATLKAGSYFGEISVLNMGKHMHELKSILNE